MTVVDFVGWSNAFFGVWDCRDHDLNLRFPAHRSGVQCIRGFVQASGAASPKGAGWIWPFCVSDFSTVCFRRIPFKENKEGSFWWEHHLVTSKFHKSKTASVAASNWIPKDLGLGRWLVPASSDSAVSSGRESWCYLLLIPAMSCQFIGYQLSSLAGLQWTVGPNAKSAGGEAVEIAYLLVPSFKVFNAPCNAWRLWSLKHLNPKSPKNLQPQKS